jgi:hypothetical protein
MHATHNGGQSIHGAQMLPTAGWEEINNETWIPKTDAKKQMATNGW